MKAAIKLLVTTAATNGPMELSICSLNPVKHTFRTKSYYTKITKCITLRLSLICSLNVVAV